MINYEIEHVSPLQHIDTSFQHYVTKRIASEKQHLKEGIPDYAFSMDYELREKMKKIPYFYSISKKISSTYVARQIQITNQSGIAVGPKQFPEIYQMGVDCAHRLGIGIPNIFIINDPTINAYTYAADDVSPIVVLHSGIVERMTSGELKCVIGHECGHIHNQHLVYKTVINTVLSGEKGVLGSIFSMANLALMQLWTRAGEVTADRAAMICADDVNDAIQVNSKLLYGATLNTSYEVNISALREQLETTLNNPTKIMEVLSDHPNSIRRIIADMEFEECEIFYSWRPELKKPGTIMRSKETTDMRCKRVVNILDNK